MEYYEFFFFFKNKQKPDSKAACAQSISGRIHKKLGPIIVSVEVVWKTGGLGDGREIYNSQYSFLYFLILFYVCVSPIPKIK